MAVFMTKPDEVGLLKQSKEEAPFLTPITAQILLFAIGFVAVSMQFIYMRQVAPFVGSSTIVSSIVVSVFLGALALGVAKGGNIEHRHVDRLRRNLLISSILLAIGPSYIVVEAFFSLYYGMIHQIPILTFMANPLIAVTIYLFIFMFPLIYLMEQSVPLLMNFMRQSRAAKQAGDAFNKSTWGNVIGGAFTTVVLMYYLGLAWSVTVNAVILCLIAIVITPAQKKPTGFFMAFCLSVTAYTINIGFENQFFVKTTPYANYQVISADEGKRHLMVNNSMSSVINPDGTGFAYIEHIKKVLFNHKENKIRKDYLVIGAGGFTLTTQGTFGHEVTYIDIDPQIKGVAENNFIEGPIKGYFIADDARSFLALHNNKTWDAIVVDAYTGMNNVPKTLITHEFYTLLKQNIKLNGKLIVNAIIKADFSDEFSRGFDNTIRSVFSGCQSTSMHNFEGLDNVVYTCFRNSVEDYDTVYVDDNTRHEIQFIRSKK